eukprot:scaffold320_cov367-Pinguiococcus_pyrenoidosus.AAC.11
MRPQRFVPKVFTRSIMSLSSSGVHLRTWRFLRPLALAPGASAATDAHDMFSFRVRDGGESPDSGRISASGGLLGRRGGHWGSGSPFRGALGGSGGRRVPRSNFQLCVDAFESAPARQKRTFALRSTRAALSSAVADGKEQAPLGLALGATSPCARSRAVESAELCASSDLVPRSSGERRLPRRGAQARALEARCVRMGQRRRRARAWGARHTTL